MTPTEILCEMLCDKTLRDHCKNRQKEFQQCDELAKALTQLHKLLPVQMADTKIAPLRDKFHYGYNSAVEEMQEAFGIEDCTQCGAKLSAGKTCEKCEILEARGITW